MSNHFLTVDDVNSALLTYDKVNNLFEVDMSILLDEETQSFRDWFRCDFVECTNIDDITLEFKVSNSLWTGGFTIINDDGEIAQIGSEDYSYDAETEILTVTYDLEAWNDCKILFYLSSYYNEFTVDYLYVVFDMKPAHFNKDNEFNVLYVFEQMPQTFNLIINETVVDTFNYTGSLIIEFPVDYTGSYIVESADGNTRFYGYVKNIPKLFTVFTDMKEVYALKQNNLTFIVGNTGDEDNITVKAYYDNELIYTGDVTVQLDEEFSFDLDLTNDNILNYKHITIEVEKDIVQTFDFRFKAIPRQVTSQVELREALNDEIPIVYINRGFAITGVDITVDYPVIFEGTTDNVVLNMNTHSFLVNQDLTLNNLELRNANTLIRQLNDDANIKLTGCIIRNCTNDENTASVIEQNTIDLSKFATVELTDCTFTNNQIPAIQHQNNTSIKNCIFNNPNLEADNVSRSLPAFVHQKANEISINNSNFDITLDTDYYTTNQIDIGVNQCNFLFGENVILNGAIVDFENDWDNIYFRRNNLNHIFAKYYYKQVRSNVIVEPAPNKEQNSFCYSVTGTDYVFKVNASIRRLE